MGPRALFSKRLSSSCVILSKRAFASSSPPFLAPRPNPSESEQLSDLEKWAERERIPWDKPKLTLTSPWHQRLTEDPNLNQGPVKLGVWLGRWWMVCEIAGISMCIGGLGVVAYAMMDKDKLSNGSQSVGKILEKMKETWSNMKFELRKQEAGQEDDTGAIAAMMMGVEPEAAPSPGTASPLEVLFNDDDEESL